MFYSTHQEIARTRKRIGSENVKKIVGNQQGLIHIISVMYHKNVI